MRILTNLNPRLLANISGRKQPDCLATCDQIASGFRNVSLACPAWVRLSVSEKRMKVDAKGIMPTNLRFNKIRTFFSS